MIRRRAFLVGLVGLVVMMAGLVGASTPAAHTDAPPATVWVCRPGLADSPCGPDLTTSRFNTLGHLIGIQRVTAPANPPVDCFYVYPTVSDEQAPQASFAIRPEIRSIALFQAARYASECRVFAPVYREITLTALFGGLTVTPAMRETAYQDVRNAFLDYLANDNHGRGVVFIGHSQGAGVLRRLLREEVDPVPAVRAKLVSAILLGGNVTVKKGSDRGGDFQNIPACHAQGQVGCVIAFSTFDAPVPDGSLFGRTSDPSREVLCTNPTSLHGGRGRTDSVYPNEPFAPGSAIGAGVSLLGLTPPFALTPWIESAGSYIAQCSSANGANVLELTPRGASPLVKPIPDATWGLHLVDANVALGNLVDIVQTQARRFVHAQLHAH